MSGFDAEQFLKIAPTKPGVYQMFSKDNSLLYVGKAKNLKNRLRSYFNKSQTSVKTIAMVAMIDHIELTITKSENEALLLENAVIKEKTPRFNVLFRDDKSYPHIFLSQQHIFPRLTFYRGKSKKMKGQYFGPYPSVAAARLALNTLQKAFMIRQCEDNFFKNRSRPCLQYQIKRCTAPCVGFISKEEYAHDIKQVKYFLEGKDQQVINAFRDEMQLASEQQNYELAARLRDRIQLLISIQQSQVIYTDAKDTDVVVAVSEVGLFCIDVMTVRGGRLLGHKAYFPKVALDSESGEVLSSFLAQYYLNHGQTHQIPSQIILSHTLPDQQWLCDTLNEVSHRQIHLTAKPRGLRSKWVKMALENASLALQSRLREQTENHARLVALQQALNLDSLPTRLECFDVSHTSGEKTVASCVVFDINGPRNSDYRRFNITDITPGDDYAAMKQALTRRYTKLKKGEGIIPDVLFIDGGKGQMTQAKEVLQECQVTGLTLVGIAKGPERKAGEETLWINDDEIPLALASDNLAHHLIQHIRDEAHRFAISGHRARRAKAQTQSILESIPGIGQKRRAALLNHFGGLQGVKNASQDELIRVTGINEELAALIYAAFHGES